jgi:hypothetical protein
MAKKKTKAVGKAAKTPTVGQLRAEISADVKREASLKHQAAGDRNLRSYKHLAAEITAVGKKVTSLKHELATKTAASKKRSWSPDEEVAFCSARAVAESLRLALGVRLADGDVLSLHRAAGGDRDGGTTILEALRAAQRYGPWWRGLADPPCAGLAVPDHQALILGLDLPYGEPHAVTVGPDGTWWSWGEPHSPADFPGAVIEEAWAVAWS